ncbi:hypothetical protein [Finegoldia magna]|uniref:hypothetical protein n=1 Tax=Finegoldia magna TaxID=1260 RepID=UPI0001DE4B00|nr:hypothetical protein [Finegoldia magna]EFK93193.1 hypothetical protein HMPREF9261_0885 [Finegoldia magna ACS-171-V-Col3]MSB16544.1 hypothetical protein [Finegoldia magna]MSD45331.1 hypothetical protein [Finegoldia magna]
MEAIIVVMLIAKCLMDLYLKRLSIKNIGVFVLISVFLCAIFRITNTTSICDFALLLGFVDMMIDDFKTNEVYWINVLFFIICSVIVSVFSGVFLTSFLALLIPVIFNFFTKERFMGMVDCLIILGLGMSKSLTDLVNFVFYLGIISGIRALIYIIRKEEDEEIAFVPVIRSSFLLYVVMGNVF